ncbi:class I SAM-dependent DNA methyltransferase [Paenibacillus agricola]|uniref:Class I SAM-dependent methyltransferase n=2 Tax=Paenibacillus agricola TaxID=2716264 RepID=A0ABX0J5Q7_9BACL|nr:class I SAM-dependent methyltransferase [Paenibacillus agricola]NHN30978.1 class I SAM-dependent methyltransferase [Paenibacillus agricola]
MAYNQFAYHYDRLMEEMPYPQWLEFLRLCWEKHEQPQTLVDLGCGTGSIAIPLAQQGFEVYGIDLSEDMLSVAQHKAVEAERSQPFPGQGSLTWLQQDMRDWALLRPVDAVISLCDCINYLLEETDVQEAFVQAFAALKPGGLFVFDVHTEHQFEMYANEQPFFLNEEDIAYIWTSELDEERCEIEHALTIFAKVPASSESSEGSEDTEGNRAPNAGSSAQEGNEQFRRVEEYHVQRAYDLDWLHTALNKAGFSAVDCYGDFTWQPITVTTQRAFFVARK